MRRSTSLTALLASLLALAAAPAVAVANATDDRIIQDCQTSVTGALTGTYTKAQLRHAKNNLPGDVLEYSGCFDAIRQALLASASGGGPDDGDDGGTGSTGAGGVGGTSGSGGTGAGTDAGAGATPPPGTPPHRGTEAPVRIAGAAVEPGSLPSIGQDANALPEPLLALLALLALAALVPAALTIGRRVVARRRA